ncbi:MAG: sigma-70 family RNA polymerase sigma factor [Gemmatimonadetes bacterium]|nr:sigma-70 family RNA polymerase sigma factor [Gemmatimonadota bacterium]
MRRHLRAALVVAQQAMRDPLDAEDVLQDALVRALERLEQCRDPARFGPWLHQIVRNVAHDLRDKQRVRKAESIDDVEPAGTANPARDAENSELRRRLSEALDQLTPMQRNVLLLFDRDGFSHAEIAAQVGCSVGMSQQHLFAARKAMRRLLGSADAA